MPNSTPGSTDQITIREISEKRRPVCWVLEAGSYGKECADLVWKVYETERFELMKPGEDYLVDERLIEERSAVRGLDVGK